MPFCPGAILQLAKKCDEIAGGEALRIDASTKGFTNVIKKLDGLIGFIVGGIAEKPAQGGTRLLGPLATHEIGKHEQRLQVVLLVGVEL